MRNFRESGFQMTLPEHSEDQCVWPICSFPFQLHPLHSLRRPRCSMIGKKRPTSSFSWIHALVIYQGYHEVSSLHLLFASHWRLHHPNRHRFQVRTAFVPHRSRFQNLRTFLFSFSSLSQRLLCLSLAAPALLPQWCVSSNTKARAGSKETRRPPSLEKNALSLKLSTGHVIFDRDSHDLCMQCMWKIFGEIE